MIVPEITMPGTLEIRKATNGQFFFNLKAGNGEKILGSETYQTKAGAQNGVQAVKANAPDDSRYSRLQATNGQYYFLLKARNGEIIGRSEMYSSQAGRENGIEAVKRDAPGAPVVDLTS